MLETALKLCGGFLKWALAVVVFPAFFWALGLRDMWRDGQALNKQMLASQVELTRRFEESEKARQVDRDQTKDNIADVQKDVAWIKGLLREKIREGKAREY